MPDGKVEVTMSDFRDEDEEQYLNDLDDEYALSRDAAQDDFANFDPDQYLSRRRRNRDSVPLDADPEEMSLDPRRRRAPEQPFEEDRAIGYSRRSRRPRARSGAAGVRSAPTAYRRQVTSDQAEALRQGGGVLSTLLSLDPGIRWMILGFGCFGLMTLIGACGLLFWLVSRAR